MTTEHTLLSHVLTLHPVASREDAATDALAFIINRSKSARDAFSEILRERVDEIAPVARVQTQVQASAGGSPDMAGYDDSDRIVALIEVKFWADPTEHQLATYWEELPPDRPSLLMFLVPEVRVKALWPYLQEGMRKRGHRIEENGESDGVLLARDPDGKRRMSIISWEHLLGDMKEQTVAAADSQAAFEIIQLQGLADRVIANDFPQRDEKLKRLIADAIARLELSGWANTEGLAAGVGTYHWVRYLRLAGAYAWFGIEHKAIEQMPDKPLWISFYSNNGQVPADQARQLMGNLGEPGLEWRPKEVCIPINLPERGSSYETNLDDIVSQLERIGKLMDPKGPTYKDTSNG